MAKERLLTLWMAVQSQDIDSGIVTLVLPKLKLAGKELLHRHVLSRAAVVKDSRMSGNDSALLALVSLRLVRAECRPGWPVVQPGSSHLL